MEVMATYEESRFEVRRRFELLADRVRVTSTGLRAGPEQTVPLSVLRPEPERFRARGLQFRVGVWAVVCGVLATGSMIAGMVVYGSLRSDVRAIVPLVVFAAVTVVGLVAAVTAARPIEFVRFWTPLGVSILVVGRAGREAEQFDAFVARVVEQIREARRTGAFAGRLAAAPR
jgi:hypothetical protein